MVRWLWVASLGLVLGCSEENDGFQCDLAAELEARAGSNATDCGLAARGEDPSSVDVCVVAAFENGAPFFARYHVQGIDSHVVFGVAGDDTGNVVFLIWDSDQSGVGRGALGRPRSG